jgi:hypothetical protein
LLRKDEDGKSTWLERWRPFSQRVVNRRPVVPLSTLGL